MDKTKSPRLLAQPRAHKEVMSTGKQLNDINSIRAFWRAVKRFSAAMGCIYAGLALLLFISAWIEGDFSLTGAIFVSVPAAWLCRRVRRGGR